MLAALDHFSTVFGTARGAGRLDTRDLDNGATSPLGIWPTLPLLRRPLFVAASNFLADLDVILAGPVLRNRNRNGGYGYRLLLAVEGTPNGPHYVVVAAHGRVIARSDGSSDSYIGAKANRLGRFDDLSAACELANGTLADKLNDGYRHWTSALPADFQFSPETFLAEFARRVRDGADFRVAG